MLVLLVLLVLLLASAPGSGFLLGAGRFSPSTKHDFTLQDSVLVQQWTGDTRNKTLLMDVEEETEDRELLSEPTWLEMFPRDPIAITNIERDYPDFVNLKVILYPNPTKKSITISGLNEIATVEIYNSIGAKLLNTTFTGETTLNIDFPSGIYFAKIKSEEKTVVKKIIIE